MSTHLHHVSLIMEAGHVTKPLNEMMSFLVFTIYQSAFLKLMFFLLWLQKLMLMKAMTGTSSTSMKVWGLLISLFRSVVSCLCFWRVTFSFAAAGLDLLEGDIEQEEVSYMNIKDYDGYTIQHCLSTACLCLAFWMHDGMCIIYSLYRALSYPSYPLER